MTTTCFCNVVSFTVRIRLQTQCQLQYTTVVVQGSQKTLVCKLLHSLRRIQDSVFAFVTPPRIAKTPSHPLSYRNPHTASPSLPLPVPSFFLQQTSTIRSCFHISVSRCQNRLISRPYDLCVKLHVFYLNVSAGYQFARRRSAMRVLRVFEPPAGLRIDGRFPANRARDLRRAPHRRRASGVPAHRLGIGDVG